MRESEASEAPPTSGESQAEEEGEGDEGRHPTFAQFKFLEQSWMDDENRRGQDRRGRSRSRSRGPGRGRSRRRR